MSSSQFSAPSAININRYENINGATEEAPSTFLPNQIPPLKIKVHLYQVFSTNHNATKQFDLLATIIKIFLSIILLIPLFALVFSFAYYLTLKNFDVSSLANYPVWVSSVLEEFIKNTILPIVQK